MPKRPNYGMAYKKEAAVRTLNRILELLSERPMTTYEVADAVHVCKSHARRYLLHMQREKMIYVFEWTREPFQGMRAYARELWAAGAGKNALKPVPLTSAQMQAMTRKRQKEKDPIGYLQKRKIEYVKSRPVRRDIAASWI